MYKALNHLEQTGGYHDVLILLLNVLLEETGLLQEQAVYTKGNK